MYALNLASDDRILSATFEQYSAPGQPLVEELPEGDITDYRYIDGEYVRDPQPKPEPPGSAQSASDVLDVLLGVSE